MKYIISPPQKPVQDTIYLPSSKSISNRMLIINALEGGRAVLKHLSVSDDTRLLQKALTESGGVKDVGHAGTAMRFLTAYYATRPGEIILTGSERMKQRPMGPLIHALRQLGATIDCMEQEGYPPLKITGGHAKGGKISIEGGMSSQFISALMMVAPALEGGLTLTLTGRVVSESYILMTLALMKMAGVEATYDGQQVRIPEQHYVLKEFTVESDWSAASYWYQVAALLPGTRLFLPHLVEESLQGDACLMDIFGSLGVSTSTEREGVSLYSRPATSAGRLELDFIGAPDLVQTCVATCCGRGIPFMFTGTSTLLVKETDRIAALKTEMGKLGFILESGQDGGFISWDGTRRNRVSDPVIQTYHDHRMAMALAPMAIPLGPIAVEDPEVVTKSYPDYWKDLKKVGFRIKKASQD
jgi:3-phosphoshikimate 1-carboxyvinyltransferase